MREDGHNMLKTFSKTRTIKKLGSFIKRLRATTTVNRFCHFVMNKNHKMCQKRSFSTATWLSSGVDCQAKVLFFLWCRCTND